MGDEADFQFDRYMDRVINLKQPVGRAPRMTQQQPIYPQGVKIFHPHQNAPQFVKGTMIIGEQFLEWFQQNAQQSQYGRQVKLTITVPKNQQHAPLNMQLDTWQPQQQQQPPHGGYQQPPPQQSQQQYPPQQNQGYQQG